MKNFSFVKTNAALAGQTDAAARFLQAEQLKDKALWARFVQVYRDQPDGNNSGWRGEFWGKMLRGAVLVYQYTRDEELYDILEHTVKDMMSVAEEDGRVSSYTPEKEFGGWDIWSRKYVMLSCLYFLEICKQEALKKEITAFICGCADYMLERIGAGKKDITEASSHWLGLNSCSVLEPIVGLYKLTGEQRYLDFAAYIVGTGGATGLNIFEKAYENKLLPYQYGVVKAYEMISCFEGLLEYALITKNEHYKTAVINFAKAVLESEESIIGSCGITHELFDHTRTRQTVHYENVSQETCVTVTWMKFCARVLELTGDSVFADAMERSFYNAYLGAINTEYRTSPCIRDKYAPRLGIESVKDTYLPFDSYSPLLSGNRGRKVGGLQFFDDGAYYGCCACIGSAGVGMFAKSMVMTDGEGLVLNFYEKGRLSVPYGGYTFALDIDTDYPKSGEITLRVDSDCPEKVTLKVRIPAFADGKSGYQSYHKVWKNETVTLSLPMTPTPHFPEKWEQDVVLIEPCMVGECYNTAPVTVAHQESEDHYVAFTAGPLVLAADSGLDTPFDPDATAVGRDAEGNWEFVSDKGKNFTLKSYADAGKDWLTDIAPWLPTK